MNYERSTIKILSVKKKIEWIFIELDFNLSNSRREKIKKLSLEETTKTFLAGNCKETTCRKRNCLLISFPNIGHGIWYLCQRLRQKKVFKYRIHLITNLYQSSKQSTSHLRSKYCNQDKKRNLFNIGVWWFLDEKSFDKWWFGGVLKVLGLYF